MLGIVASLYDYDWQDARQRFRQALDCDPVPSLVRSWPGYFMMQFLGPARDWLLENERAIKEDPLNFVLRFTLASCLFTDGDYTEGDAQLRQSMDLAEGNFAPIHMLSVSLAAQDRLKEALPLAERAHALGALERLDHRRPCRDCGARRRSCEFSGIV
jgi:hypothetical protein